jgi:hypothetical protein
MAYFLLVHSPSVGPATWQPVAERLRESGHQAAVPSLLTVAASGPPFWPRVVGAVRSGLPAADPREPLVLVAHSNAGLFVPVIADGLGWPVACTIFADAAVPGREGETPLAPDSFLRFLRGLAGPDGRLPRWTDWWEEADVAPMFPSQQARDTVTREQPRLPLAYYRERVPVPAGWDKCRCCYLRFSAAYRAEEAEARERGWPVRVVPGEHLHQIVDPRAVTGAVLALAAAFAEDGRPPPRGCIGTAPGGSG